MRSGSRKPSSSSAKQFRRITLPHVGSTEKEVRAWMASVMVPVTKWVYRRCLVPQTFTTEARVWPSSEVGLPLATRGRRDNE